MLRTGTWAGGGGGLKLLIDTGKAEYQIEFRAIPYHLKFVCPNTTVKLLWNTLGIETLIETE